MKLLTRPNAANTIALAGAIAAAALVPLGGTNLSLATEVAIYTDRVAQMYDLLFKTGKIAKDLKASLEARKAAKAAAAAKDSQSRPARRPP